MKHQLFVTENVRVLQQNRCPLKHMSRAKKTAWETNTMGNNWLLRILSVSYKVGPY